jgi:hypothetical protein
VTALPFICPVCKKELMAGLSLAMQHGLNRGHGSCLGCNTFLSLAVAPGGQCIQAIRHSDHIRNLNSGKAHDSREVARWRAGLLAERVRGEDALPNWAVRYALKQNRHAQVFLGHLTFTKGAEASFREESLRQRRLAEQHNRNGAFELAEHYADRADLMETYARRSRA